MASIETDRDRDQVRAMATLADFGAGAQKQLAKMTQRRTELIREGRWDEARELNEKIMELQGLDISSPAVGAIEAGVDMRTPLEIIEDSPWNRIPRYSDQSMDAAALGAMEGNTYGITAPTPEGGPADNMTELPGLTVEDLNDPSMLPPVSEPVIDSEGVETTVDEGSDQVIREVTQGDRGRGGSSVRGYDPDAEWGVASETELSDSKFLPGARKKVLNFFGHETEEEAQRFGSSLMAFGAGVLTGGPDLGEAIGHGFQKSQEAFHGMKRDQRQASLDDLRIAREEERLDMAREEFNQKREQAAADRALTDSEKAASGKYVRNKDGHWVLSPDYIEDPYNAITDKKMRSQIELLDIALKQGRIDQERYDQLIEQIISGGDAAF